MRGMSRLFGRINVKTPQEILNSTQANEIAISLSVSIDPSDLATKARKIMRTREIRALPVTEGGNLKGILRSRDLLKITSTHSNIKTSGLMRPPALVATPDWSIGDVAQRSIEMDIRLVPLVKDSTNKRVLGILRLEEILDEIADFCGETPKVDEIMTEEVLTINPNDQISKVWNKMEESNISGIPVVENDIVKGMITRIDILKSGRARFSTESEKGGVPPKIRAIMNTPAIRISSDASIKEAAVKMKNHSIGRVPVTKEKKLIGIIDREDVIKPYI